jgi:hypothetical protein
MESRPVWPRHQYFCPSLHSLGHGFPSLPGPVTGVNMNYCGPIFLAVVLFATTLWFVRARKHWDGPNVEIVKYVIAQG